MPKDCQDCTSCTPPKKRFWLVIHLRWCALVAVASMAVWTVGWAQDNPALLGQWSAPQNWPARAIHAHLLPTGKVLFWDDIEPVGTHLWDPATNTFSVVSGPGYIHYCTGHSLLASGQLFIAGGHVAISVGLPNASIFDPVTGLWTRLPNMNDRRWYPTVTTLPSGDVVVVSGHITAATNNNILPQVWQTATGTWRDLTGAQRRLALYPWLFVAPNGKVFHAGSGQASLFLDTSGTGSWTFVANTSALNRESGTAVMYGQGKVIVIGGADPPLATAEVIDLNSPSPAWRDIASMSAARRQPNATLLPDGTVLVTGGSSGEGFDNETAPVLAAELWNPATETWTSLASSTIYRGYHSVAFLLPDGRVVTAGGTDNSSGSAEIFSPPYLFRGPRPTISSAPTALRYDQTFFVGSPDAADIARVTWVRLSSVTHTFNANQRFNELGFTQAGGGLQVTAPADGALCPPGHYLLFLLDGDGVPSVGKIVRIEAARRRRGHLPPNSVVNGASFRPATEPNSAIASGAIVAIFGTNLASTTEVVTSVPLSTTLGETSVTFNDIPAPLFFVSDTQINAQVPFELMTGAGMVTVQVKRGSETSEAQPIGMAAVSPGIFTLNKQGTGQGAILIANTPFLAAPAGVLEDSRPAQRGEFISIFCTGLGSVQPEVPSGDVAPSTAPLAETLSPTLVNISNIPALVTFSGLAPGFVGLYQVNVQVPMGVPSGPEHPVEIIIDGVPSNTVTLAVQ